MRKTRIRRKFRKRATHKKTRKTRKNIHKSKKQKISRRYSRRRVMRGGVVINDEIINKLNVLRDDTYILIGYGDKIEQNDSKINTFILYNKINKNFYYYNYDNNKLHEISNRSLTVLLDVLISERTVSERLIYDAAYLKTIIDFFKTKTNLTEVNTMRGVNIYGEVPDDSRLFTIKLGRVSFSNFHIAHHDTNNTTVHAYGFANLNDDETIPIFIFKDEHQKYYLSISDPIEYTLLEYEKEELEPMSYKPIIDLDSQDKYTLYIDNETLILKNSVDDISVTIKKQPHI